MAVIDRERQFVEILIVEDSRTQAQFLQHLLEGRGYVVSAAIDGGAGLAAARRKRPDLIISDVEMPVMTGYEMCRAVKDDPALLRVPVILLTSLTDAEDVLRGLEAGADYYLTKPYDSDYLLSQVEQIIAASVGRAAADDVEPSSTRSTDPPLEVVLGHHGHSVSASRRQILSLLMSTYGGAVQRNRELVLAERKLQEQNRHLELAARAERDALEALKRAQAHLVQSEKLAGLGQMVAGVAHEINNPLAFVGNNIAILQRDLAAVTQLVDLYAAVTGSLPEAALAVAGEETQLLLKRTHDHYEANDLGYTLPNLQDILTRSREGVRRIQQIVKDLRDFARLDASDLSEVDVNAGIESVLHIIRSRAVEKQVSLELVPGQVPRLTCYPAKLNQVVMNLISNAIDASKPGDSVRVRTESVDGEMRIKVSDTGCGIEPSIRDRIFDPFFTTKPIGQGTGLGLSISYGIVRDHGGRIEVESELGKGALFTVRLPLRPPVLAGKAMGQAG